MNALTLPGLLPTAPNSVEAFLRDHLRDSIHLVAISPNSPEITAKWFGNDAASAAMWAQDQNTTHRRNVYFTFGIVRQGLDKKPTKNDMIGARGWHVDIDPPVNGLPWDKNAAFTNLVTHGNPSVVISTGRGLQALWFSNQPLVDLAAVEAINRGIAAKFGGDHCHNADRLLRLPGGLVNYPNAKKRASGYVPTVATVVHTAPHVFDPVTLAQYFPAEANDNAPAILTDGPCDGYTGPADDDELIKRMLASRGGMAATFGQKATVAQLWTGDAAALAQHFPSASGDVFDRSAADAALMSHLAWWTAKDAKRMDRLFRRSALMRDKYAERATYATATIAKAVAGCSSFYTPSTPAITGEILTGQVIEPLTVLEMNELAISQIAADNLRATWRYCYDLKSWLRFNGSTWVADTAIDHEIGKICEMATDSCYDLSVSRRSSFRSHKTFVGIRRLMETNPQCNVRLSDFDPDPWLLNTPGGVVDLRTGTIRPATPDDLFMQSTSVAPADTEDCPTWHRYCETTWRAPELRSYMKRALGYMLTASVKEHAIFVTHGKGGDGKGVMMTTTGGIMGAYGASGAPETFINTRNSQHLAFVATMKGKRRISVAEMPPGMSWNHARINAISAGDEITANFMGGNPFTFRPTAKLLFSCNDVPALRSVGNDAKRRFHLIPFETIPEHLKDKDLLDKLKAEWSGILRWMINGCLEWQRIGLAAPQIVIDATQEFIGGSDTIAQWLEDESQVDADATIKNDTLLDSYNLWAVANGHEQMTMPRLSKALRNYGLIAHRAPGGAWRGWKGRRFKVPLNPPGLGAANRVWLENPR